MPRRWEGFLGDASDDVSRFEGGPPSAGKEGACHADLIGAGEIAAPFNLAFVPVTERAMDHLQSDQIEMLEALAHFRTAAQAAVRAAAPAR